MTTDLIVVEQVMAAVVFDGGVHPLAVEEEELKVFLGLLGLQALLFLKIKATTID